jgi:outer membrane scaffolding protein for murein synthesis (MipA/OmpV family)
MAARSRRRCLAAVLLGIALGCTGEVARATRPVGLLATEPLEDAPGVEGEVDLPTWDLRVGLLGVFAPDYEGAADDDVSPVPYVRLSWKERIIFRGRSLEANLLAENGVRAGPLLVTRHGRDEDDNRALTGLGDVDRSFEAGAFVRWRHGPYRLRANVLQDVSSEHEGLIFAASAAIQFPFEQPWFVVEVDTEWADGDYLGALFGIDAVQSQRSGLPIYDADAGFKHVGLTLVSRLPLNLRWSAILSLGYRRLLGDAADSPLVEDRGEKNGYAAAFGLVFQF